MTKIWNLLKDTIKYLFYDSRLFSFGFITFVLVLFVAKFSFDYIKPRNYTIGKYYSEGGAMTTNWIGNANKLFQNTPKQLNILQLYNKIVRQRKTFHKSIVINLLTANEVFIIISILCGAVSVVVLTFIASDGWNNVDIGYKSVFTTTTLLSIISFSIIKTFKVEENIAFNFAKYKEYDKIQLDITQHISTIGLATDNDPNILKKNSFKIKCDSLVNDINRKIYNATDLKISIDLNSIKMAQIMKESGE